MILWSPRRNSTQALYRIHKGSGGVIMTHTIESDERTIPADNGAERAVISLCMLDQRCFNEAVAHGLTAEHFYMSSHRTIFSAMGDLLSNGSGLDETTIATALK